MPANFNQDLTISFGTSTHTGFSSDRQFTIPAAEAAKDGLFHVYRLDLGLQVWWKDTLNDLRLQPLGSTGAAQTASIDYVEVGDVPNDVLSVYSTNLNMAPGVTAQSRQSVQSKHFVFWYDPNVNPGGQTDWSTMTHNALHMLEEAYQVYTKVDGYKEPFTYVSGDATRYKINMTTWYSGYWESGPYFNVDTTGLQDEGSGNPVPHEFGHVVDSQQGAALAGGHWESHANYHKDSWAEWFSPYFPSNQQATMSLWPLEWSNFRQDSPRLIYADYRIFTVLQNYSPGLEAQLWYAGSANMTVFDKLATILPKGQTVANVVAAAESHWPMLDFQNLAGDGGTVSTASLMRAQLWDNATDQANYFYLTGSTLVPEADQSGWYQVPLGARRRSTVTCSTG